LAVLSIPACRDGTARERVPDLAGNLSELKMLCEDRVKRVSKSGLNRSDRGEARRLYNDAEAAANGCVAYFVAAVESRGAETRPK
jgi:hypothetical protein